MADTRRRPDLIPRVDYQEMLDVAKNEVAQDPSVFSYLGAVSDKSDEYFISSTESDEAGIQFLNQFYAVENNLNFIRHAYHLKKSQKNKFPQAVCMSFATGHLEGEPICFVTHTPLQDENMKLLVKECVEKCNQFNPNVVYEYIKGSFITRQHIEEAIANIRGLDPGSRELKKPCAEKNFASGLIKIFSKYGDRIQITGVTNTYLYPFLNMDKNNVGQFDAHGMVKVVSTHPSVSRKLDLDNGMWTSTRPCCPACQANKPAILALSAASQGLSAGRFKRYPEYDNRRSVSPDDHSLASGSLSKAVGRARAKGLFNAARKHGITSEELKVDVKNESRDMLINKRLGRLFDCAKELGVSKELVDKDTRKTRRDRSRSRERDTFKRFDRK